VGSGNGHVVVYDLNNMRGYVAVFDKCMSCDISAKSAFESAPKDSVINDSDASPVP
jgi:hypothetical protein